MKIKVSIALDEELVARIDRVAKAIGAKRSGIVQRFVERQIEEAELLAGLHGNDAARIVFESPHLKQELMDAIRKADEKAEATARTQTRAGGRRERK